MDDRQETIFHVGIKPINRFLNTAWAVRKDAPLYNKVFIETIEIFMNAAPQIALVAAEASGDLLAAHLITALRKLRPESRFFGIGGPLMRQQGMECYFDIEELAVMGFSEVLHKLPRLVRIRRDIKDIILKKGADIFIGVDAPDFNFALERIFHRQGLTTIHYVSPSVWAWRQGRIHGIKASIDLVLCLFPFEKVFFKKWDVPAAFVGHPLASQLPLENPILEAQTELGLDPDQKYIALLPGSRRGEIERLGPLVLDAANTLHQKYPDYTFLIPAINDARKQQIESLLATYPESLKTQIRLMENTSAESKIGRQVMNASNIIALASGTATLEAMLLHRPMVTFYKLHWLTYRIAKLLVKIPYFSLPNIIAGKKVIQELIQSAATPENLAAEIEKLMDIEAAQIQVMQHITMHKQLLSGNSEDPVTAVLALVQ